jgi:penicillin-binding protein 2
VNLYSNGSRKNGDVQIAVFQYLTAIVFLWLIAGFWQLQVQSPEVYEARAERNRIKSLPLLAPRGKLLDRDGRILVDNSPSYKVLLSRSRAAVRPDHLAVIAEGLNIPYADLRAKLDRLKNTNAPEYQAVIVKEYLTPQEVAFVDANRSAFPELELIRSQKRLYPRKGLASHVIGYVGEISDEELDREQFMFFEPGAEIGKAGIERGYNDVLSGVDGSRQVIVDSLGREREVLRIVDAQPGRSLRLTLDLDLQVVAELAMEGRRGAVVALDPRNGEVRALVSRPNYDPNEFVGGIGASSWRGLMQDPQKPMLNRAIQAQLAPGSIFKPVVALAGTETGVLDDNFQVVCRGGARFYGRHFACHLRGGHGAVTLQRAMAQSCNVFFATLGDKLGIDKIAEYSALVGLGRATGIDLPNEAEGTVPSTRWKLRFFREKWYAGETISVSIGQGALTVTPLQMAYAYGGLAMRGVWHQPHLIPYNELRDVRPGAEPPPPVTAALDREKVDAIVNGLRGVVSPGGTGMRARLPGQDVCGKTGTAQLASMQYTSGRGDKELRDTAWFVAFAPCDAPEIAVAALFEHGEHGHLAAPIARDVIKAHFDKQQRIEWTKRIQPPEPQQVPPAQPETASLMGQP